MEKEKQNLNLHSMRIAYILYKSKFQKVQFVYDKVNNLMY